MDTPGQRYCSIGSDNFEGGLRATSHLLALGRSRIAFIGQTAPITTAQTRLSQLAERLAGFRAAMAAAHLPADMIINQPAQSGVEAGARAVQALIARGQAFDAIVASSDRVAIGAMQALAQRGLSVPGDVAIVGYDDAEVARFVSPGLTTIRQDPVVAGQLLVTRLIRAMAGYQVRSERLPTDLVIRGSCGGTAASSANTAIST